ncbi:MAG: glutamate--tRNA ligase [Candidatus Moranbacteria bacterium]|nr:glutamate--tRNA ligase [Candidatus Moranbacteria bacterium]
MKEKIRVRFAPSPTGYMHVGNFRTALYTYLFARKEQGTFIVRLEDTDQKRYVEDALEKLLSLLQWAGFEYTEGVYIENGKVVQKGDVGPYIQSERLEIYKEYAQQAISAGHAYHCFCTPERLEEMRKEQVMAKRAPMYDRACLKLSSEEIAKKRAANEPFVVRQKIITEGMTEYDDLIRGKVIIKNELLDDQILIKSDGYPTYNFANVIDDHLMRITHVTRGEEYISSTPKYIQLYQNFGWEVPKFAHLPLLLNADKSKLSKRQGDVAVEDYIAKGYLKEAIINFVALLGWNPGQGSTQELFSLEELVQSFDIKNVHKSGAVFDLKKLDWMSSEYIKKLSIDELYERISHAGFLEKSLVKNASHEMQSTEYLKKVLLIERDRLTKLSDIGEQNEFFFVEPHYETSLLHWKGNTPQMTMEAIEKALALFETLSDIEWDKRDTLERILLETAGDYAQSLGGIEAGRGRGDFLWPLRVALTGAQKSPSPSDCAFVLGKTMVLKRLQIAISKLS